MVVFTGILVVSGSEPWSGIGNTSNVLNTWRLINSRDMKWGSKNVHTYLVF